LDEISSSEDVGESLSDHAIALEKEAPNGAVERDENREEDKEEDGEEEERPRTLIPQKLQKVAVGGESKSAEVEEAGPEELGDLEMESQILGGTTIGKDAELRLQRARYKALERNIGHLVESQNEKEKELKEQRAVIKELRLKIKKVEKERDGVSRKLSAEKKQSMDLVKKCKRLEAESYSVASDLRDFKKEHKAKTESMRNAHIRLNRALEDAEKYRNLWAEHKNESKSSSEIHNKELVRIKKENRVLIKQKNELLSAFKKQNKLIDILKKQKIHWESAKVLQFTESQFVKTLDIGQHLK